MSFSSPPNSQGQATVRLYLCTMLFFRLKSTGVLAAASENFKAQLFEHIPCFGLGSTATPLDG